MQNLQELIMSTLRQTCEDYDIKFSDINEDTKIFGSDALLDSLGLVVFISELEDKISSNLNKDIVIANEKAMSMRVSPFRDVKSLEKFIKEMLDE
ncbi:hypothetical protein [Campylobacter curvus]|uniref:hypothetical protein n=1 Tax=Campylobacter curvus TaxID=200 RepID=UPI000374412D|nr:hypothetical protein [Campylobacter curvus]QKF61914.1 hypothetical protein CCVT_1658 [Campylobacter curvus]UEB50205.1 hypothetical protein LK426_01715 [Campylobacter curvus]